MITPVGKNEISILVNIWLKASLLAHGFIDAEFWKNHQITMEETYLPAANNWAFRTNGNIIGFYSRVEDTLAALFVAPSHHNQKIGTQLLEHAQKHSERLTLTVYAENKRAVDFYKKHKFSILQTQRDLLSGHSEHHMLWEANKE